MDTQNRDEHAPLPEGATGELTTQESWDLLRQAVLGRLAVVHDDGPDIFPVNYTVDRGTIVLRTAAGTKYAAARNNRVAFEVDGYDLDEGEAWSVVARGRAKEVRDVDDAIDLMSLPLVPWAEGSKPHLMRLEPDVVTGRRIRVAGGARRS